MSDNDSELGSFLAGFVIGGLVGAAVALVLAPQSGSETRSQIAGKGQEVQAAGERTLQQAGEAVDGYTERAGQFGQDVEQQARIVLDAGRQRISGVEDNEALENPAGQDGESGTTPAE
jgi:gas vesicle protein